MYEATYEQTEKAYTSEMPERLSLSELIDETHKFMCSFSDRVRDQKMPNSIFFLDKSARPLAYIFKKLFPVYFPGATLPAIRFINISPLSDASLERSFKGPPLIVEQTYGKSIDTKGRILIVDDYKDKGESIQRANDLFTEAFPEAIVETQIAYTKIPVWYWNDYFKGVDEYEVDDYKALALKRYNEGTNRKLDQYPRGQRVPKRLKRIYGELEGTIPHTKRGTHTIKTSQYEKAGIKRSLWDKVFPFRKTSAFLRSRRELDTLCREIARRYV
ncbi:hypothetical protein C4577_05910 [Candidatus Parcubacteria bacterium]|nr:MAG: hypothetical protein C4577_05910 [Candidatus Parcubacteria bacterium]